MADEKLNTSPEENPQPSLFDTGPAEAPTPEPPAPAGPCPFSLVGIIPNPYAERR